MVYFSQNCEEQPECLPCTETFKKGKGFFIMKKLTALLLSLLLRRSRDQLVDWL